MPLYLVSQERITPGYLKAHAVITKAVEAGDAKLANSSFRRGRYMPPTDWVQVKNLDTHEVTTFA